MAAELVRIQVRADNAYNWTLNDPHLLAGEIGFETDTGNFKIGDGTHTWTELGYIQSALKMDVGILDGNVVLGTANKGIVSSNDIQAISVASTGSVTLLDGTTHQLKLAYDSVDNTTFFTDDNGNLTITPSGTKTITSKTLEITSTSTSINKDSGALIVNGGVGVEENVNIGNNLNVSGYIHNTNTAEASSSISAPLKTAGGLAVAKNVHVGTNIDVAADANVVGNLSVTNVNDATSSTSAPLKTSGGLAVAKKAYIGTDLHVGNDFNTSGQIIVSNITDATSSIAAPLKTAGGLAVAKKAYIGTDLNVGNDLNVTGDISALDTTDATSSTSAPLKTAGGLAVAKSLYVGTDLNVTGDIIANDDIIQEVDTGSNKSVVFKNKSLAENQLWLEFHSETTGNGKILIKHSTTTIGEITKTGFVFNENVELDGGNLLWEDGNGILQLPRYTTAQKNLLTPSNGYTCFDSDFEEIQIYSSGGWSAPGLDENKTVPIGSIVGIHPSVNASKALDTDYWVSCDSTGGNVTVTYRDGTTDSISLPDLTDDRFLMGGTVYGRDGTNDVAAHGHAFTQPSAHSITQPTFTVPGHYHGMGTGATLNITGSGGHSHTISHTHTTGGRSAHHGHTTSPGYGDFMAAAGTLKVLYWGTSGGNVWGTSNDNADHSHSTNTQTGTVTGAPNPTHTHPASNIGGVIGLYTGGSNGNAAFAATPVIAVGLSAHSGGSVTDHIGITGGRIPRYFKVKYFMRIK